ncbi:MAG: hypothetical protein ABSC94_12915, partial [Polyangiaceae bacterium]
GQKTEPNEGGVGRRSGTLACKRAKRARVRIGARPESRYVGRVGEPSRAGSGVDEPAGETGKVRFLPVRVAPSPSARATSERGEIEVILVNGRRVRISGEFDAEVVAKLLEIAERGRRC